MLAVCRPTIASALEQLQIEFRIGAQSERPPPAAAALHAKASRTTGSSHGWLAR
jgi:hypothetical protein